MNDIRFLESTIEQLIQLNDDYEIYGASPAEITEVSNNVDQLSRTTQIWALCRGFVDRIEDISIIDKFLPVNASFLRSLVTTRDAPIESKYNAHVAYIELEGYSFLTTVDGLNISSLLNRLFFVPLLRLAKLYNIDILEIKGDGIVCHIRSGKTKKNALLMLDFISHVLDHCHEINHFLTSKTIDDDSIQSILNIEPDIISQIRGKFTFKVKIGISSGEVFTSLSGDIDSKIHFSIRGNPMNSPPKLQSLAKELGAWCVIDEPFNEYITDAICEGYNDLKIVDAPFLRLANFPDMPLYVMTKNVSNEFIDNMAEYKKACVKILESKHLEAFESLKPFIISYLDKVIFIDEYAKNASDLMESDKIVLHTTANLTKSRFDLFLHLITTSDSVMAATLNYIGDHVLMDTFVNNLTMWSMLNDFVQLSLYNSTDFPQSHEIANKLRDRAIERSKAINQRVGKGEPMEDTIHAAYYCSKLRTIFKFNQKLNENKELFPVPTLSSYIN